MIIRQEMTATFSVCPKKPSYKPACTEYDSVLEFLYESKTTFSEDDFVDLVFHEVLHTWVVENLENSRLRRKYRDEAPSVKNHMHLMAIQKFVYLKIGRPDLVSMLDDTQQATNDAIVELIQNHMIVMK